MSNTVADQYHRHALAIEQGQYSLPTHAVAIEFAPDGPRLMCFGLQGAHAREQLSVLCDAIAKLGSVASDFNAQASN